MDGLVIESTSPFMRHIQQHNDLEPLGPNLQQVEGVWSSFTKGTNLNILYFD